jgi:hypothetical protein
VNTHEHQKGEAMKALAIALAVALATVTATPLNAAPKDTAPATQLPVVGTTAAGDTFAGVLSLQRFGTNSAGNLVAIGTLTGTITNAAGQVLASGLTTVALPAQATGSCDILHLDIGPIALDLLGLQVNLSRVVLDIRAVPGAGNLLGNLLCAVTGLLNNPSSLAQLLNQILAILQSL